MNSLLKFFTKYITSLVSQEKKLLYIYGSFFIIQFVCLTLGILLDGQERGISTLERINGLAFGIPNFCTILLIPAPYYEYTYLYSPMTLISFIYLFTYIVIYLFIYFVFKNKDILFKRRAFYYILFVYMLINSYFIEFEKVGNILFFLFPIFVLPSFLVYIFDVELKYKNKQSKEEITKLKV